MRLVPRCLGLLIAASSLVPVTPLPAQVPRAERPTYAVGQKWIRDDGTYELTRIDGDRYVFTASRGREIRLTRDLAIARVKSYQRIQLEFEPPPVIQWPLEVGKTWVGHGLVIGPPEEGSAPSRYDLKVASYEDVKIGPRTVKAFQIHLAMESLGVRLGDIRTWYAPEVGQIVRIEARETGHYSHGGTPPSISMRFLGARVVAVPPSAPAATAATPPAPPAAAPAPPPPPVAPAPAPAPASPRPPAATAPAPRAPAPPAPPAPTPTGPVARGQFTFKVTYRVTGSAGSVALTYRNSMGGTEQTRVRLPWEVTFDAQGGTFLYLSAQNAGVDGAVTCEIALDDEVRTRSTSTGAYVIAECSNAAERN